MHEASGQTDPAWTVDATPSRPPISTSVATSSAVCHLSGDPPFTVTTTYRHTGTSDNKAGESIWALIYLSSHNGKGIDIRDPQRQNRRMGPSSTNISDEWDEDDHDVEDSLLVRLQPGQEICTSYTFSVVAKAGGLRNSDIRNMIAGNNYEITLKKRRWRWMFENQMDATTKDQRREILERQKAIEWEVDCKAEFEAV